MKRDAVPFIIHLLVVIIALVGLFVIEPMTTAVPATEPDDDLTGVFERISVDNILQSIESLSRLETRRFDSLGARAAVSFIATALRKYNIPVTNHFVNVYDFVGEPLTVTNVLANLGGIDYRENPVIFSAHYDSRLADPRRRAPGADDNASGVAVLLESARVITEAGLKPKVSLVFFGGEEDSLIGSDAFAEHVVELGFPLHGVINVDMVGYDEHGPKDIVIFTNPQSVGLAREVVRSVRRSTRLAVDTTMTTYGNSDHVSFWRRYRPAVSIWEGYDHNPYHCTSGDTTGVLTPDFLTEVTRLIISLALDLGGLKDVSPETAQQGP